MSTTAAGAGSLPLLRLVSILAVGALVASLVGSEILGWYLGMYEI
jgi:hypothetical protein